MKLSFRNKTGIFILLLEHGIIKRNVFQQEVVLECLKQITIFYYFF